MTAWGVLFGGPSPEHEISILTGLQAERVLTDAGEKVLFYERARDELWDGAAAAKAAWDARGGVSVHPRFAARRDR